jgi:hypothetical protein
VASENERKAGAAFENERKAETAGEHSILLAT